MDHIFCEIEIFLCEGAAYIILIELPIAALFNEPLVFRHDGTIATAAVHTEAKRIINLFAPINRENDIGHLDVYKRQTEVLGRLFKSGMMKVEWQICEVPVGNFKFFRNPYYGDYDTNFTFDKKPAPELVPWNDNYNGFGKK